MKNIKVDSFENWERKFKPKRDVNGEIMLFDTSLDDLINLSFIDNRKLWSIMLDGEKKIISPGCNTNALNFLCTEKKWEEENKKYFYDEKR